MGWGRSGGRQRRGPAAPRLTGELGEESYFLCSGCRRSFRSPSGQPRHRQPRNGRRKAGSAASGLAEDGPARAGAPQCPSRGSSPAPARNCQGLVPRSRQPGVCQAPHRPRDRLRDPTRRGAAGNLEGDEGKTLLVRWVWRGLKKKKRLRQIRREKGTKGRPPTVTLRDKGPRTLHTCSHARLGWGGDPNSLT